MNESLDDRYVRVDDYASRVDELEFSNQVWSVFGQLDQPRSPAQVATALKITPQVAQNAFRRLFSSQIIRAVDGAKGFAPGAVSTAPFPTPVAAAPTAAAPAKSLVAASVEGAEVCLRLVSDRAQPYEPLVNLMLGGQSLPARASAAGPSWRLRPVLDAIGAKAGGGLPGQMLVYKVFLQLPPDLLKETGLQSLNVVDDKFTVSHPLLRTALIDAARRLADIDVAPLTKG